MKKPPFRTFPILLAFVCLLSAGVARSSGPKKLSIDDAIRIALESNLALRQASGQVELKRIEVDKSRAAYYPSVGASLRTSGSLGGAASSTASGGETVTGSLSAGVNSSLNLFNGFGDRSALEESKLSLRAGGEDLARQRQLVVFETISRFVEALTSSEFIRVSREHLESQKRQLDMIEEYQRAGKRPIADVYQQQAEVAAAELALLGAERDHQVSKLNLQKILGRSAGERIEVVPFNVDGLIAGLAGEEGSGAEAPAGRPDLRAQQSRVEATARHIDAARAGYWPSLDLSLDAGTSYATAAGGAFADQLFDDRMTATLGLSLTIPIFDRTLTTREVEQAHVQHENERLALEELGQQAQVELLQAREDYLTTFKQLAVTASQLKSAEQSLAALEERYRVGASTLAELSLARARHLESSYDRVKAKYDLLLKAVAVRYYQGDLKGMLSLVGRRKAS